MGRDVKGVEGRGGKCNGIEEEEERQVDLFFDHFCKPFYRSNE